MLRPRPDREPATHRVASRRGAEGARPRRPLGRPVAGRRRKNLPRVSSWSWRRWRRRTCPFPAPSWRSSASASRATAPCCISRAIGWSNTSAKAGHGDRTAFHPAGEPEPGGGRGVGQPQHWQPPLPEFNGLARFRGDVESRGYHPALGSRGSLPADGFRHPGSLPARGGISRAPQRTLRAGRRAAGHPAERRRRGGEGGRATGPPMWDFT